MATPDFGQLLSSNLKSQMSSLFQPGINATAMAPSSLLEDVIDVTEQHRLRSLLKQICRSVPDAARLAQAALVVDSVRVTDRDIDQSSSEESEEDEENEESEEDGEEEGVDHDEEESEVGDSDVEEVEPRASVKRKSSDEPSGILTGRYVMCENCDKEYDVTDNKKGDCCWHEGHKECYEDDDFWADHDEDCHGIIDQLIDEPDFAEGFKWTCCDQLSNVEGCMKTRHRPTQNSVKRARVE